MITKVPYYFKDFECIASDCPDTCCAGWEIVIDGDTYNKYKTITGEFGERLHSEITHYEDGEPGFKLKPNNDCPFLNKKKLCDIYSNLGKDHLCYTCKQFPRFTNEYGSLREVGLSISCPEAARLILKDKDPVTFETTEDDEMVDTCNDISVDMYMAMIPSRKTAMKIAQDRSLSLKHRICLLLSFAEELQEKIDDEEYAETKEIRQRYLNKDYQKQFIDSLDIYQTSNEEKYELMKEYINVLLEKMEPINEGWPHELHHVLDVLHDNSREDHVEYFTRSLKDFEEYYKEYEYEFEHLIVYLIFRYFMESVYDYDVFSKIKFAALNYIMVMELDTVRYLDNKKVFTTKDNEYIMHLYSKEIEHSLDNMDTLAELFNTEEIFSIRPLLSLIV